MKERNLDLQSAMDVAGELCHQSINKFEADRSSLPSWGEEVDRDVQIYVQGLQDWIVGSLHWSFVTRRYFGTEGEAIKQHRTIQLLPQKVAIERKEATVQKQGFVRNSLNCLVFPSHVPLIVVVDRWFPSSTSFSQS